MPTRNINLTPELDKFVARRIREGRYANASEVLRAGLRALEEDEKEDQIRLEALRAAIQAGDESGIAEGDVFEEVRDYIRQLAAEKANVA
jgi:antitoxin ParD1/3/4